MKLVIRIAGAIAFVAMIIVNWLAERGQIAGVTTGEVSAKYPVLLTPAGYAFSIWILIYTALAGYVIYSFTRSGRKEPVVDRVAIYFVVSSLLNISWLLLWQYELLISSVFVMYALFIALIGAYLEINRRAKEQAFHKKISKFIFVLLPFMLYTAWINNAAIINTAVVLKYSNWNIDNEQAISIILVLILLLFTYWLGYQKQRLVYLLVVVWALTAIAIKQYEHMAIFITVLLAITVIGWWYVMLLIKHKNINPAD